MTETKSLRPRHPVHPGRFVRTVIIDPLGLTVTEAARVLGITRVALRHFLNEQAALSPEMAIRLDKAFRAGHGDLDEDAGQLRYRASPAAAG